MTLISTNIEHGNPSYTLAQDGPVEDPMPESSKQGTKTNWRKVLILIGVCVVVAGVTLGIVVPLQRQQSTSAPPSNSTTSSTSIKECKRSRQGTDYQGYVNVTGSGLACQPWASQIPHSHSNTEPRRYPDRDLYEAVNYCRNPDLESSGVWCYTMDPDIRWGFCDVPRCSEFPECKVDQKGEEYRGHVDTSQSGKTCRNWDEIPTDLLLSLTASGRSLLNSDENYCRANPHPSEDPSGPWCYVEGGTEGDWELCNVPLCKPSSPCKTEESGARYAGTVSMTKSGLPCQRWDKQTPHPHDTEPDNFPEGSLTEANNFCRNPDGQSGPWCYTLDADIRSELCHVPLCGNCKVTDQGREYAGTLSATTGGTTCISWLEAGISDPSVNDPNMFPDAAVSDASNYCRNPDGKSSGPWCYTSSSGDWGFCDLPLCPVSTSSASSKEPSEVKHDPLPRRVRHVVHIGIDGLHPCFVNAPGGAPNIVKRLGENGSWTRTLGRTVLESVSAPGWSTIITGMPTETTGIYDNSYRPPHMGWCWPITPTYGSNIPTPTVFTTLKSYDNNIRTAAYYDWDWWIYMTSYGVPGSVDNDHYCDIKSNPGTACDAMNAVNSSAYITQILKSSESSYTLVYFDTMDNTGHSWGWCGEEYLNTVDWMDQRVGEILNGIEEGRQNPYDEVLVILSSDHGGTGTRHGMKVDSDLQVPLYLRGGSIKKNYQFTKQVNNQDLVPTAVHLMGFPPNHWWTGNIIEEALIGN